MGSMVEPEYHIAVQLIEKRTGIVASASRKLLAMTETDIKAAAIVASVELTAELRNHYITGGVK